MSLIVKNLFVGNLQDAYNKDFLIRNNINLVINCCQECADVNYASLGLGGMTVYHLHLRDDITQSLQSYNYLTNMVWVINDHLSNNKGGVLVHCFAGVSRSVSIVIAYLMCKYKLSFEQALAFVRKMRPIANPNPFFQQQLRNFNQC